MPTDDGQREGRPADQERVALADPALDDRMAGAGAGDDVHALSDVVDLVEDIGAGMQEHARQQRAEERRPVPGFVHPGQGGSHQDRNDRRGERERPKDLVQGPNAAPSPIAGSERPIVGEAERRGTARRSAGGRPGQRRPSGAHRARDGRVDRRGSDELVDLAILLEDRLEERQLEPGLRMEGHRARGDVLARPAQHEGIEQLVGDEVARGRVVLGPPGGGDPVAKLLVEPGPSERDVREHRHHVDDEWLPLRPVERLAPGLVDERQEVAGRLDRVRVPPGGLGRGTQPRRDAAQRRDRFRRARQVAIGLLTGELDERLAVGRDDDRDPVGRREHRLDGRQPRCHGRQPLPGPQGADLVDRGRDALDGGVRVVGDAHLLEPQRQPGAHAQDEPAGQDLVQRGARHRQDDGVAGERVGGAERDPEAGLVRVPVRGDRLGDRGREADPVTLEVAVVDPHRLQALVARLPRPADDLVDVAAGGKAETDGTGEGAHGIGSVRRQGLRATAL